MSPARSAAKRPRAPAQAVPTAVDGRVPGRRGRLTRERLLTSTAQLLETRSYRDLTVIEIARSAGTSPATFYQYFPSVEDAILVLAGDAAGQGHAISTLIENADWRRTKAPGSAREFVDEFLAFWERHRGLLRVVDLATAEGDLRFQNIRTHMLNEITVALRDVVARAHDKARGSRDVDPMAQAATLISMLAHVAAHRYGFEFWGIRTTDLRASLAALVAFGVTGRASAGPR